MFNISVLKMQSNDFFEDVTSTCACYDSNVLNNQLYRIKTMKTADLNSERLNKT